MPAGKEMSSLSRLFYCNKKVKMKRGNKANMRIMTLKVNASGD
jgi:hypothetical protein